MRWYFASIWSTSYASGVSIRIETPGKPIDPWLLSEADLTDFCYAHAALAVALEVYVR